MSTLKDKFENFEPKPDDSLWQSITETLQRRAIRRRRVVISSAVAVVAVAAVVVAFFNKTDNKVATTDNSAVVISKNEINVNVHESIAKMSNTDNNDVAPVEAMPNEVKTSTQNEPQTQISEVNKAADATNDKIDNNSFAAAVSEPSPKNVANPIVAESHPTDAKVSAKPDAVKANERKTKIAIADDSVSSYNNANKPVKAASSELYLWVPNAFAPDDPNDEVRKFTVKPTNVSAIISYEIYIYSRGGKLVFHSRDINEPWDGTFKGHAQPMGTYVYIIQMNVSQKGVQHQKGTVTLIR